MQVLKALSSFKFSSNAWTTKAEMLHGGRQLACGMVTHEDGDREIIATGERSNRVQIYNIATDTWRIGGLVF